MSGQASVREEPVPSRLVGRWPTGHGPSDEAGTGIALILRCN